MKDEKTEVWAGENRFYLGEDDIIYVDLVGDYDLKNAFGLRDAFKELLKNIDGKVDIFVDNSRSGKPSREARKVFTELTEHEQIRKIAVFGLNPVAQMIASFVLGSSKNKNTKMFKTREEALAWIKE